MKKDTSRLSVQISANPQASKKFLALVSLPYLDVKKTVAIEGDSTVNLVKLCLQCYPLSNVMLLSIAGHLVMSFIGFLNCVFCCVGFNCFALLAV